MGIGRFLEAESEEDNGAGNRHGCGQHHPCLGWRQNWTHHHRWSIYLCVTSVCSWERKEKREMENERGKRIENCLFIVEVGLQFPVSWILNLFFSFFSLVLVMLPSFYMYFFSGVKLNVALVVLFLWLYVVCVTSSIFEDYNFVIKKKS